MADAKAKVLPYVNAGPTMVTVTIQNGQKTLPMLQEFQINVTRQDGGVYQPGVEASIKVDGENIGYCRSMYGGTTKASFMDYLGAPGASPGELTRFKFQPVAPANQATATVVNNPDEIKAGRIRVGINALSENLIPSGVPKAAERTQSSPVTLPDGKKFFMAPSLSCGKRASNGAIAWSATRYQSLGEIGSVEIHYETVATLMLRKVLVPTVPEHKRIIDEFGLQAAAGDTGTAATTVASSKKRQRPASHEGSISKAARKGSRPSKAGGARSDAAVKAEPGTVGPVVDLTGTAVRPAAASHPPVVVDLTGDGPLVVNGKALRKDQRAVCDLTEGAKQRGGAWQVVDKVKEEVELD